MADYNRCCAIVVAAGNSSRMGSKVSKIWLPLLGVPAIVRTLFAFEQAQSVDDVVVVCREQDQQAMKALQEQYCLKKLVQVVCGADTRQQSVARGVAAVPDNTGYVAIHDGARPLIQPDFINQVIADARQFGASTLAIPARDTMKLANQEGFVEATPPRERLWSIQTPQVFQRQMYCDALAAASGDFTDDCQLIEQMGGRVHLCLGSPENLKLTTPEDMIYAEAVLQTRKEQADENRTRI